MELLAYIYQSEIKPDSEAAERGYFYTFNVDGTYRYSEWEDVDQFSQWKIKDGVLCVKHQDDTDWLRCDGEDCLAERLILELEMRKLLHG